MKKIIKSLAAVMTICLMIVEHANAFCGFGQIIVSPPTSACTCSSNKIAIKKISGNVCQEERCVSQGLVQHYLNQGWIYGCCSGLRMGKQSQSEDLSAQTFPNPVYSLATTNFSLNNSQKVTITLLDVNSRIVSVISDNQFETGNNKVEWNASDLNDGIYFLQIRSDEISTVEKLVVTH